MAAPTPYELAYDFTAFQTSNPTTPLPADKIEIEFNAIQITTDDLIANLALIQRSDGALANGIVTPDSLSAQTTALIGASAGDVADVADNIASVITVAGNTTNINTCATNMAAIIDAPTQASNAAISAAKLAGTSTSNVTPALGTKSFTTQSGKQFNVGQFVQIVSAANPTTKWMHGQVTAYSGTSLTVDVKNFMGAAAADWSIYVAAAAYPVTLPGTTVDNTLPRFDGTNGAVQTSGITVDDSNNVSGIAAISAASIKTASTFIEAAATLTAADFGKFIQVAAGPYSVALPTPVGNGGAVFTIWKNTSANITLTTPAGLFYGSLYTAANSIVLPSNLYGGLYFVVSDGANWIVHTTPNIDQYGDLRTRSVFAQNASGYGVHVNHIGALEIIHASAPFIDFKDNPADDFDCRIHQIDNGLSLYTGGQGSTAIRAKLTSVGDWLVGPSAWVTGYGFSFSGSNGYSKWYRNSSTATDGTFDISSNWGATNRTVFTIRADGNVLNYNNSYGALSDARLKENVEDASPKLEKVKQVRWVTYNKIGDDFRQLGVIAQELQKISPTLVSDDGSEDKILSVKYSVLYSMYCAAFNELAEVVDDLKSKNAALEARLAALEAKVLA